MTTEDTAGLLEADLGRCCTLITDLELSPGMEWQVWPALSGLVITVLGCGLASQGPEMCGPDLELESPPPLTGVGVERGRWRLQLSRWSFSQVIDPIYSRRPAYWFQNGDS